MQKAFCWKRRSIEICQAGQDCSSDSICAKDWLGSVLGRAHRPGVRQVHGNTFGEHPECLQIEQGVLPYLCSVVTVLDSCAWMAQDHSTEAYQADLSALHEASASRLRRLCQSNGGVYVKAAQLLSTAQSIPQEYRQ